MNRREYASFVLSLARHTDRMENLLRQIQARQALREQRRQQLASGEWQERTDIRKGRKAPLWKVPKAERARCGARTRKGLPCQCPVVFGKERCRLHGGCSTGPKTEAGRAAIAESNRRRAQVRREAIEFIATVK